jgi:hypothetical protein
MSERSAFETPAIKRIEEEKPFEYIVQHLENAFGEPVLKEKSDPLAMLIRVILSQATTDALSRRTFENLKRRFKSWAQAAEAAEVEIADAIKLGGLSGQKAAVIKNLLAEVKMRSGAFSLDFLEEMPADEARDLLLGFRGSTRIFSGCSKGWGFCPKGFRTSRRINFSTESFRGENSTRCTSI